MAHYVVRFARRATIVLLFVLASAPASSAGCCSRRATTCRRSPRSTTTRPTRSRASTTSRATSIGEFATERRVVVTYEQISPLLRQAIIAAEDQTFEDHLGLSIPRIVVTAVKDIVRGERYGASTLTQQLARNLFLTNEKTWERKVQGS